LKYDLNEILSHFTVKNSIEPYGDGHINDTYVTAKGRYILQRINSNVFKKPDEVMDNCGFSDSDKKWVELIYKNLKNEEK